MKRHVLTHKTVSRSSSRSPTIRPRHSRLMVSPSRRRVEMVGLSHSKRKARSLCQGRIRLLQSHMYVLYPFFSLLQKRQSHGGSYRVRVCSPTDAIIRGTGLGEQCHHQRSTLFRVHTLFTSPETNCQTAVGYISL